jgi:hypothetical protein
LGGERGIGRARVGDETRHAEGVGEGERGVETGVRGGATRPGRLWDLEDGAKWDGLDFT